MPRINCKTTHCERCGKRTTERRGGCATCLRMVGHCCGSTQSAGGNYRFSHCHKPCVRGDDKAAPVVDQGAD